MSQAQHTTIREFRQPDLAKLKRLIHEIIDVSYSRLYPPRAVEFFKEFHSEEKILSRSRSGTILVTLEDGELVATGSMVDGEIFAVFVHPKLQNGGLGKALTTKLEDAARAIGVIESELSISLPSKSFYQGLGYEIVEEKSPYVSEGRRFEFWKAKKIV